MKIAGTAVLISLLAFPSFAMKRDDSTGPSRPGRHLLVTAEHPLQPFERRDLEADGLTIIRELGSNRYIARLNRDGAFSAPSVRAVEEFDPQQKIARSVARVSRNGSADVFIVFQPDIQFSRAMQIAEAMGATPRRLLATDFSYPFTLEMRVPLESMQKLAQFDEVSSIHGARRVIREHNATAARISHVTELFSAPYDLSGQGVILSLWEVGGNTQTTHPEFEGRVINETPGASISDHATHVAGTITAKGINPDAKGMAPKATVHQFVTDDDYLQSKETNYSRFSILADNNSWGYVLGWDRDDGKEFAWDWWDGTEDFGNYAQETAGMDQITRAGITLPIFSAGNDDTDNGPTSAPFAHYHESSDTVYCYSTNGTGTDCPLTPCQQCEKDRHPPDGPFGTMSLLGAAKNVIAVGAVASTGFVTSFSSRGPATDGRIKPDLVAKGSHQFSTFPTSTYSTQQGTSMAAPVVTGIAGLLVEQYRRTFGGANPDPELLRALLIHGADDLGNAGPDYTYGWGLVDAKNSVDTIIADDAKGRRIQRATIAQGVMMEFKVAVDGATRVTLAWSDPENTPYPVSGDALVNDLDLTVIGPNGQTFLPYVLDKLQPDAVATTGVNHVDNIEQVNLAGAPAGSYTVRVSGTKVATNGSQSFVLLSSRDFGPAHLACVDPFETNNSASTAWGRLPTGSSITPALCEQSDLDFFRFDVDRSGTVSVIVTATDVPLKVTLTSPSTAPVVQTVAANSSATLQTNVGSGTNQVISPVTFTVEVEPAGTIADPSTYTLRATYPNSQKNHRRPVRR
jgi:hypothetical protein